MTPPLPWAAQICQFKLPLNKYMYCQKKDHLAAIILFAGSQIFRQRQECYLCSYIYLNIIADIFSVHLFPRGIT